MKIAEGRMIRKRIAGSKNFAKLSPKAQVLFTMMIPHYNAHGKMNGGSGFIKDEVCPLIKFLTTRTISRYLREISRKTSVKYFRHGGRWWIHSINFNSHHQKLKIDRLGDDHLPSYPGLFKDKSRTSQDFSGECPPEVKKKIREEEVIDNTTPNPMRGGPSPNSKPKNGNVGMKPIKEFLGDVLKRNT